MRNSLVLIPALLIVLAIAVGPAGAQSAPGDAVEMVGQGSINWTSGQISATGIGVPPANPANPAQARAMALRAAQVVALRNLLEIVKGVRVDSETVVENFMTKSDVIRTHVDGIVRGAQIVKTSYLSDGSVEVTVAMGMRGALLDAVVPESFGSRGITPVPLRPAPATPATPPAVSGGKQQPLPPQPTPPVPGAKQQPEPVQPTPGKPPVSPTPEPPKPSPPSPPPAPIPEAPEQMTAQFKGGKATGVVIDGRGLGLRPALLPKIVDPQGQEIYVGQVVTRTNAVEQGVAGYAKDVSAAANNFRVTDNPAVFKGLRAAGTARTDVVLSQSDALTLRDLGRKGDFLQFCRVIIVY